MVAGTGYTPNYHDVLSPARRPTAECFRLAGEDRTVCTGGAVRGRGGRVRDIIRRVCVMMLNSKSVEFIASPSRGPEGGCSQSDLRGTGATAHF